MSVQFPSDNNSSPRRKPGGILPLLIMAGIAFVIFRSLNSTGPGSETTVPSENESYRKTDFPEARLPESAKKDQGDWGFDEVATQRNPKSQASDTKRSGSVTKDDWSMEDGPTRRDSARTTKSGKQNSSVKNGDWSFDEVNTKPDAAGGSKVDRSNPQGVSFDPTKKSKPSKTIKGDWSFEEIDN